LERLTCINGLRGIAILLVIVHHCAFFTTLQNDPVWMRNPLAALTTNGWTGVNLFFVLSGFVLFLPYARGKRHVARWRDALVFFHHRALRLLPLFYFIGCVALVLAAGSLDPAKFARAAYQLLTFAFATNRYGFMPAVNPPLWSLGVEVLFSLAFPAIVVAFARLGMLRVLAAVLVAALAARIFGRLWSDQLAGPNFFADNIFGRLDEFVIGMVIAQYYATGKLPHWAPWLLAPGVALIAAAWLGFHYSIGVVPPHVTLSLLNLVLDGGIAATMLALLSGCRTANAVLAFPPLQVAGMMCYSLYVWHFIVLGYVAPAQGRAVALLLVAALAAFTYRFIEFRNVPDWRTLFLIPTRIAQAGKAAQPR